MRFFNTITKSLFCLMLVMMTINADAQNRRYLDPVFSEVTVSAVTPVASNFTILNFIASQGQRGMQRQPLVAQFFSPKGDTRTDRPLVIYVHTGNFFPYPANGSCGGTLRDSSNIEIATRLAKMGYVVAVVNYRQGWNPLDPNELIRRYFLINAAYRGVQDMKTYVRYFRRSVAEQGNPHGIDAEKITIWGQGTGGYLSLAAAYLNTYNEILTTSDPKKFILPTGNPALPEIPMVLEQYNGNVEATGPTTIVDALYSSLSRLKIGDTLCIPNHVGFSSLFKLAVNMGGALGDSTWINAGEVPLISYHVTTDPFAPCGTDVLNVPTATGAQPVLEVSGSCDVSDIVDRKGLNEIFKTIPAGRDPMNQFNKSNNLGFYEFRGTPNDGSGPWEWAAGNNGNAICNTNARSSKIYIDTIMAYFAPRACVALGLNCDFASATNNLTDSKVNLTLAPNPASSEIRITVANDTPIQSYQIMDISGRTIRATQSVNTSDLKVKRDDIQNGMYFIKLNFEKGSLTKKVIFE